jgi:hypothetical protein
VAKTGFAALPFKAVVVGLALGNTAGPFSPHLLGGTHMTAHHHTIRTCAGGIVFDTIELLGTRAATAIVDRNRTAERADAGHTVKIRASHFGITDELFWARLGSCNGRKPFLFVVLARASAIEPVFAFPGRQTAV